MIRIVLAALLWILVIVPPGRASTAAPGPGRATVIYQDGLVTIRDQNAAALGVLQSLSRQADIHIFLFEPLQAESVQGRISREPLERFLERLLKGHNHAVSSTSEKEVRAGAGKRTPG